MVAAPAGPKARAAAAFGEAAPAPTPSRMTSNFYG